MIDPNVTGVIDLLTALPKLSANMTILGPGANLLTIERKASCRRQFRHLRRVERARTVNIADVTIANADSTGVVNNGALTLSRVDVLNNHASGLVSVAPYGGPGGIFNTGTLTVQRSTVANNSTANTEVAAGIDSEAGAVFVLESTISGNVANNTNSAGGIGIYGGSALIAFSTITQNVAIGPNSSGGGVDAFGFVQIYNSIIAGNTASAAQNHSDVAGTFSSLGHNLIGSAASGVSGFDPTDLVGTVSSPINAQLDPTLKNNGGTTLTHALLPGSPAINAGNNSYAPPVDQRGSPRISASTVDIGAFELNAPDFSFLSAAQATFTVGQANSFPILTAPPNDGRGHR